MTTATYPMPARSLGMGAIVRRRTPAGAIVDHVIDRIEHRAGDEVRIDLVDPATGWGAFLVLDGNVEVDVVIPDPGDDGDDPDGERAIERAIVEHDEALDAADEVDVLVWSELDDDDTIDGGACIEAGVHILATRHRKAECPTTPEEES